MYNLSLSLSLSFSLPRSRYSWKLLFMVSEYILDMCVRLWWWIGSFVLLSFVWNKRRNELYSFPFFSLVTQFIFPTFSGMIIFLILHIFLWEGVWLKSNNRNKSQLFVTLNMRYFLRYIFVWVYGGGGEILAIITYLRFVNIWVSFGEWPWCLTVGYLASIINDDKVQIPLVYLFRYRKPKSNNNK